MTAPSSELSNKDNCVIISLPFIRLTVMALKKLFRIHKEVNSESVTTNKELMNVDGGK